MEGAEGYVRNFKKRLKGASYSGETPTGSVRRISSWRFLIRIILLVWLYPNIPSTNKNQLLNVPFPNP